MSHNRFLSEIFENLDVDYQMLISLGKNEPFYRPRNQFFSHVIGIYFISFFVEHPVVLVLKQMYYKVSENHRDFGSYKRYWQKGTESL